MSCAVCGNKCDESLEDSSLFDDNSNIYDYHGGFCEVCGNFICSSCIVTYPEEEARKIVDNVFANVDSDGFDDKQYREDFYNILTQDDPDFALGEYDFDIVAGCYDWLGISCNHIPAVCCPICQNQEFSQQELMNELFARAKIKDMNELKIIILTENKGSIAVYHRKLNMLKKLKG